MRKRFSCRIQNENETDRNHAEACGTSPGTTPKPPNLTHSGYSDIRGCPPCDFIIALIKGQGGPTKWSSYSYYRGRPHPKEDLANSDLPVRDGPSQPGSGRGMFSLIIILMIHHSLFHSFISYIHAFIQLFIQ